MLLLGVCVNLPEKNKREHAPFSPQTHSSQNPPPTAKTTHRQDARHRRAMFELGRAEALDWAQEAGFAAAQGVKYAPLKE
jgi:hypothetical protein